MTTNPSSPAFKRVLGPVDLTLLGIGGMLGTGIFVLSGRIAATNAGPGVVLSFMLAAVAASLAALCYAELASLIPGAGSAFLYAYTSMGPAVGFLMGWNLILEYGVAAAMVSGAWSGYLGSFLQKVFGVALPTAWSTAPFAWHPATGGLSLSGAYCNLPALGIILLITGMLLVGTRASARANAFVVMVKLAVIITCLVVFGQSVDTARWSPLIPENTGTFGQFGVSGVLRGACIAFFAYAGFDAVSTAGQEARKPQVHIPIAICTTLVVGTTLYAAVALVLTGVIPYAELNVPNPVAIAAARINRPILELVVEIGALLGLTSTMLMQLLGQSRILYSMSEKSVMPRALSRIHSERGLPHVATGVTGVLCAAAAGMFPMDLLAELSSIGTLLAFVIVSIGVTLMRYKRSDAPRAFRLPGGPWLIPGASTVVSLSLMSTATEQTLLRLIVWGVIGAAVYKIQARPGPTTADPGQSPSH